MIQSEDTTIVIDAGPDFRQQMLSENVEKLDAILITHEHRDHIGGMDDVRAFNYLTRKAVDIYCDERVMKYVRREYPYAFAEKKYPGSPHMNLIAVNDKDFIIKNIDIQPVKVCHYRLSILAYRIGSFAYITDANEISEKSMESLHGLKYLVINALRKEKHISHFTLSEALDVIRKLSPEKAFITHISHQMGIYSDICKELPDNVILAYDGLSIEI